MIQCQLLPIACLVDALTMDLIWGIEEKIVFFIETDPLSLKICNDFVTSRITLFGGKMKENERKI